MGVLIDHNPGGIAKDLLVGADTADITDAVGAAEDGAIRFEETALDEAATLCREALWRTDHTLDPPVSDDYESQRAAVALHLRALPDGAGAPEFDEIDDATRDAAIEGFVTSPEGERFRGRDDALDLARLAVDYCADYLEGNGRPLRWSPTVVELFMTWFPPRKVLREPEFFERVVSEVLPAWVRYAGRARGIPAAARVEAVAAVGACRDEMLAFVREESAWGRGKAFARAAQDAGIDLEDPAAVEALVAGHNRGAER